MNEDKKNINKIKRKFNKRDTEVAKAYTDYVSNRKNYRKLSCFTCGNSFSNYNVLMEHRLNCF